MSRLRAMTQDRDNVVSIRQQQKARRQLLEHLFSKHGASLRVFLRARTRVEDIEDIVQEVFVRLARMPNLEERLPEAGRDGRAFIFTAANNLIVDLERRKAVRKRGLEGCDNELAADCNEMSPEIMVAGAQELGLVERAILELPPKWRTAFVLNRFKYMNYKEIAERMGVTTRTVENYMSSALERIRAVVCRATGERK